MFLLFQTVAASIVRTRSDEAEEKRSSKSENLEDFPLDENDPSSDFLRYELNYEINFNFLKVLLQN